MDFTFHLTWGYVPRVQDDLGSSKPTKWCQRRIAKFVKFPRTGDTNIINYLRGTTLYNATKLWGKDSEGVSFCWGELHQSASECWPSWPYLNFFNWPCAVPVLPTSLCQTKAPLSPTWRVERSMLEDSLQFDTFTREVIHEVLMQQPSFFHKIISLQSLPDNTRQDQ